MAWKGAWLWHPKLKGGISLLDAHSFFLFVSDVGVVDHIL